MNEQPTYDQFVAASLEQLPVPDMADAIWGRIKAQLDTDMPEEGGSTPPSSPPPHGPLRGWRRFGLFAFLAALLLIYIVWQSHTSSSLPDQPTTVPPSTTPVTTPGPSPAGSIPAHIPTRRSQALPAPSGDSLSHPAQPPADSSVLSAPVADSIVVPPLPVPSPAIVLHPPGVKDSMPVHKPKGVKGISESDYRIVPKQQR